MSFIPRLVISYDDLQREKGHLSAITNHKNAEKTEKGKAYMALCTWADKKPTKYGGERFIIVRPEFTAHDKAVRKLMDNLSIHYVVDLSEF